jgi:redox-regulated HSP33 family molecular chaperone
LSDREPLAGPLGAARAGVARAEPGGGLDRFTVVMATGIVSAAVRQAGLPWPSRVLLGIAAAAFTILANNIVVR